MPARSTKCPITLGAFNLRTVSESSNCRVSWLQGSGAMANRAATWCTATVGSREGREPSSGASASACEIQAGVVGDLASRGRRKPNRHPAVAPGAVTLTTLPPESGRHGAFRSGFVRVVKSPAATSWRPRPAERELRQLGGEIRSDQPCCLGNRYRNATPSSYARITKRHSEASLRARAR